MKSILPFFLISIFLVNLSFAQKPVYEWIRTAQGTSWDEGLAIACDNNGNTITTGYFDESFSIDDSTFDAGNYSDIFLIKHDSEGDLIWAKQLACESGAWGNSVLLDDNGNSILTGYFSDSIRVNNVVYYGYSIQTGFIAKFDQNGDILWFNIMGSENGWIWPSDLVWLNNGNIICAGMYGGTVMIGDSAITTNDGGTFLVQYSPIGDFIKLIEPCTGTVNYVDLLGIASDSMDNIFIGGNFRFDLTFSDTSITNIGYHDIFIAKFDNQGIFQWVRQEGNIYSHIGLDVAADHQGNSAITGYFSGTMIIGDTTLTALGSEDIFIIKYNPEGNVLWARKAGGNVQFDLDEANGIAADNSGNFYLAGNFEGSALFGDTTLVSSGSHDIFCAKYNSIGDCIWAAKVGGTNDEWGDDIAINNQGDILLTGWYCSDFMFGDTLITNTDLTDVCVIKLTESEINSINRRYNYLNQYYLSQNYPNPFNPTTKINYTLPKAEKVKIEVFNLLGQRITTLLNKQMPSGSHEVEFTAKDLPSGVYLYRIVVDSYGEAGDYLDVRKMILLK